MTSVQNFSGNLAQKKFRGGLEPGLALTCSAIVLLGPAVILWCLAVSCGFQKDSTFLGNVCSHSYCY